MHTIEIRELSAKHTPVKDAIFDFDGTISTLRCGWEQIMEKVWGYDSEAEINVVWVYISYLRKKLIELNANVSIKATRGVGYSLEVAND